MAEVNQFLVELTELSKKYNMIIEVVKYDGEIGLVDISTNRTVGESMEWDFLYNKYIAKKV